MRLTPQDASDLVRMLRQDGIRMEQVTYTSDLDIFLPDGEEGRTVLELIRCHVGNYGFSVFESERPSDNGAIIARIDFGAWVLEEVLREEV